MAYGFNSQPVEIPPYKIDTVGNQTLTEILSDWFHASRLFRSNSYRNAPKFKFLYHVYFDINPAAYTPSTPEQSNLIGILVREVKLPSYTFTTHQLNQYNRKRIVQTKIKYDPVNFQFHDDNNNTIAKMWAAYYTYYYADGSIPGVAFSGNNAQASSATIGTPNGGSQQVVTASNYDLRTQYVPSNALPNPNNWGYIGETNSPANQQAAKVPFFKNITIFGLNRHNFLAYTLINPIITSFSHDTYNYDDGSGTMRNIMNVDYETVVYNEGQLDGTQPGTYVTGFGNPDVYDRDISPITKDGTQGYVLSTNGLQPSEGGEVSPLRRPNTLNPTVNNQPTTTAYAVTANNDIPEIITTASRLPPNNPQSGISIPTPNTTENEIPEIVTTSQRLPPVAGQQVNPVQPVQSAPTSGGTFGGGGASGTW
jgi:hypothetical protein